MTPRCISVFSVRQKGSWCASAGFSKPQPPRHDRQRYECPENGVYHSICSFLSLELHCSQGDSPSHLCNDVDASMAQTTLSKDPLVMIQHSQSVSIAQVGSGVGNTLQKSHSHKLLDAARSFLAFCAVSAMPCCLCLLRRRLCRRSLLRRRINVSFQGKHRHA